MEKLHISPLHYASELFSFSFQFYIVCLFFSEWQKSLKRPFLLLWMLVCVCVSHRWSLTIFAPSHWIYFMTFIFFSYVLSFSFSFENVHNWGRVKYTHIRRSILWCRPNAFLQLKHQCVFVVSDFMVNWMNSSIINQQ